MPQRHHVLVTDRVNLSPKARDFLHTSIRHDRSRRRRTITVLSMLLILALVAAGVAVIQRGLAQERQRIATARQLVTQADATRDTDPLTALQLGIAAQRIHPDNETHASLVNTLTSNPYATYTLSDHNGPAYSVAFSPDGRTLATASDDRTVILWNLSGQTQPRRLGPPLTGHTGPVTSVAFSPDRRTLATGSDDRSVILWDLSDPAQPRRLGPPLTGHTGPVPSVAFSPDGRTLTTAGRDNTAIPWDLTDLNNLRAHATERACSIAGSGLDRGQWDRYIPGLPYQDTCSA